jgi:hypothetical protein
MRGAARDGSALKQYYDFSLNSAKAAQVGSLAAAAAAA